MSPIANLSDIVRIPRLGKVHLGIKVEQPGKSPYPKATDYFVVPPEVAEVFGEQPKELPIMFPTEDPNQFAQQWLRRYSLTQGLVCIGDGMTARRKIDLATGATADRNTKDWEWKEGLTCDPQECPEYMSKHCRRVMNLQFLIPECEGLGVWQVDSSSFYSILNINSMIRLLKATIGRCSMIPLTLALGPIEVTPPGQTKKVVHVMHIKKNIKLADLARLAQLPAAQILLPEPETAEPPEDLFPTEVLEEAEARGVAFEDELTKGWVIAQEKVKAVGLTEEQIARWWAHYRVQVTLSDFEIPFPPPDVTVEMVSRFIDILTNYEEKQREKAKQQQMNLV